MPPAPARAEHSSVLLLLSRSLQNGERRSRHTVSLLMKAPNPNKSQIPASCWGKTQLIRISPHLSWVRAVRPSEHRLAHYWAIGRQSSFLPIHGWLIHTNSAALPNPPNRPSLKPPMLPASHGQTWSLLTKLHPQLFHPDKRLGCPGCSWLISKLLLITAGYINTGSTLAAASTQQKAWGDKNPITTPIKNRAIDRWTTWKSK